MRRLLLCTILCFWSFGGAAAGTPGGRPVNPIRLAPADSVVVARVNWAQARRDNFFSRVLRTETFERTLSDLGIVDDEVSEIVLFSDFGLSPDSNTGMILNSPRGFRNTISRLKIKGWAEQVYNGNKLYSDASNRSWLAPLRSGLIAAGTRVAVEKVIKAQSLHAAAIMSNRTFNRLAAELGGGRHTLSVMMAFPKSYQYVGNAALKVSAVLLDFAGAGLFGELLNKIGFAQGLGFSISRSGTTFPMQLTAIMRDEAVTSFVSGALNLLKGMTTMMPRTSLSGSDKETMETLQSLSVVSRGEVLSLRVTMKERDLAR